MNVAPYTPTDDQLLEYARLLYQTDTARILERKRNPHLEHDCETPQYEVQAQCHPDCIHEELAELGYDNGHGEHGSLMAIATCGAIAVWMD